MGEFALISRSWESLFGSSHIVGSNYCRRFEYCNTILDLHALYSSELHNELEAATFSV